MTLLETAQEYRAAGLNVLPAIKTQKRPVGSWKQWTTEQAPPDVFNVAFDAICVVCGSTSGGVEVLDFDFGARALDEFLTKAKSRGLESVVESALIERSQSGGAHLAYRSPVVEGNLKLADVKFPEGIQGKWANEIDVGGKKVKRAPDGAFWGNVIETRGEGGICIISPTNGYEVTQGSWTNLPTISLYERDQLFEIARSLNERPQPTAPTVAPSPQKTSIKPSTQGEGVADYLRANGVARDALKSHGWIFVRVDGDWEQYSRPDQPVPNKVGGGYNAKDGYFHCFSSNAHPLEPNGNYSPLQLIAALDFGGDVSAASKFWARKAGLRRQMSNPVINMAPSAFEEFSEFEDASVPTFVSEYVKPIAIEPPTEQKKTEFPQQLFQCDGFIQETLEFTESKSARSQPEGAFLSALACQSYLAGRSMFFPLNGLITTPVLYALFLAPSGMGKEALRGTARLVSRAYDAKETTPEAFASVQALQNSIVRRKKLFWLHDEFGRDLKAMTSERGSANVTNIITEALKLYTSGAQRAYLPKLVADEAKGAKKVDPTDRPSLTIFATGNPSEFYDAANETILRNGYIARFTLVEGRTWSNRRLATYEEATDLNFAEAELPPQLIERVQSWRRFESLATNRPFYATIERDAFDLLRDHSAAIDDALKDAIENETGLSEIFSRLDEKTNKYALLFAQSKFGANQNLRIDRESVESAILLADYEKDLFVANANEFARNAISKTTEKALAWAKTRETFRQTDFTRKFQTLTKREREDLLETLEELGAIVPLETNSTGGRVARQWTVCGGAAATNGSGD